MSVLDVQQKQPLQIWQEFKLIPRLEQTNLLEMSEELKSQKFFSIFLPQNACFFKKSLLGYDAMLQFILGSKGVATKSSVATPFFLLNSGKVRLRNGNAKSL